MGQILVKFDPTLVKKPIEMNLVNTSMSEVGEENYIDNKLDVMQSSVYGVLTPIIKINNMIVDFSQIEEFSLSSEGPFPTVSFSFFDTNNVFVNFSLPGSDNFILVQILPPFDNAYKKINLEFYITSFDIDSQWVTVQGVYKLPDFMASRFKAYGQLSTDQICEMVAKNTKLGFATNVQSCDDKRWIYCNHISFNDLLRREINYAGKLPTDIYDWWIDFWDYINLVNIYERYNSIDQDEDMLVWVSSMPNHQFTEGYELQPVQIHCMLTNNPALQSTDLAITSHSIINHTGNSVSAGTDKVYSIYDDELGEYKDTLVQDGDIQRDVYQNYEYVGESVGGRNYLLSKKLRSSYMQKMTSEMLEVDLASPMLGISKGSKVDVVIYENDSSLDSRRMAIKSEGLDIQAESNIPLGDEDENDDMYGSYKIKRNISGQYYVMYTILEYADGAWNNRLFLTRPKDSKYDPFNEIALMEDEQEKDGMSVRDNVEGLRGEVKIKE